MTSDDAIELVSEMKRMGVLYFKFEGLEVAFSDAAQPQTAPGLGGSLFSDQATLVEQLEGSSTLDGDGKPAIPVGYTDEDLYGSAD